MAINVVHSPSAGSVGTVARQAGLGQYSLIQQQMIAQQNARKQQERMQKTSIEAQQARDLQYQGFQREMDVQNFQQGVAMNQLAFGQKQDLMDNQNIRNTWQDAVGRIKNFDSWTPAQKNKLNEVQRDIEAVMMNRGLRPEEKASALRQGVERLNAIQSTVVPKKPTQQEQWAKEGKGVGDTWIENGAKMGRGKDLIPKVLIKPITLQEIQTLSKQAYENTMMTNADGAEVKAPLEVRVAEETRLRDQWYQARGMDEMMSTYVPEFQAGGETFQDFGEQGYEAPPEAPAQISEEDAMRQAMENVGWRQERVEGAPIDLGDPGWSLADYFYSFQTDEARNEWEKSNKGMTRDEQVEARKKELDVDTGQPSGQEVKMLNAEREHVMKFSQDSPKASEAIGLTVDNALDYPKEILDMLPALEHEFNYVEVSGSKARQKKLRERIQKINAIMMKR